MSKIPTRGLPLRGFGGFRRALAAVSSSTASAFPVQSSRASSTSRPSTSLLPSSNFAAHQKTVDVVKGVRFYSSGLPSHHRVALPALSPTMELGTVVSWQKKIGDQLSEGDLLCEIETDKATMGFETPEEGYLAAILIEAGARDVPIGKTLCVIVQDEKDIPAFANYKDENVVSPSAAEPATAAPVPAAPTTPAFVPTPVPTHGAASTASASSDRVLATPFAKKIAAERGLDLSSVSGSGPGGRVLAVDLENATSTKSASSVSVATASSDGDFTDIPVLEARKEVVRRLVESKRTIPPFHLTSEIEMDAIYKLREKLNGLLSKGGNEVDPAKISLNDFVIKASALACQKVPECNSFFMDSFIRQNNSVDVSVAVTTPAGFVMPVIRNAHAKGLATISREFSELAMRARDGKLRPDDYEGGTFSVAVLGSYGIHNFSTIILPPQACILAVGTAEGKLVPDGENGYRSVKSLRVTLSCDHRVVDGAVGAVWLRHFKQFLEKPSTMLL